MGTARRRPEPGEPAPHFSLRNQYGESRDLHDLRGAPSVVMFFPFAFSRVCSAELADVQDRWAEFDSLGARLCAVSCDSLHALRAYAEDLGDLRCDLLSDFWPHGETARAYGSFDPDKGCPRRATFVLGPQLTVHSFVEAEPSRKRDLTQVLGAVRDAGRV